jgi:flagellar biosynthesis protein FlhF
MRSKIEVVSDGNITMKIKRFFAKDMRSAMAEVKEVLGADAVIMSNKKVVGGIEIVAAVDYQAQNKKEQEAVTLSSQLSSFELKEDNVQLSSLGAGFPNPPKAAPKRATRQSTSEEMSSKDEFAKSLNSFFGKMNAEQGRVGINNKPTGQQRSGQQPRTLAEQQNWSNRDNSISPPQNQTPRSSSASRVNNKEIARISGEVASLRKLLEHQVSGLMWQEMERKEPIKAMIIKWLKTAGFSDEISDQLANQIPEGASATDVQKYIPILLQDKLYIGNNDILEYGGAIALLGPTGVGKTTTIAKLAAQFAMKYGADQVALITTDTYRIGAHEQLAIYGKIMGCSARVAKNADELSKILYQFREKRLVLIDTAGMGQRDVRLTEQLDTLMKNSCVNIQSYLVISSTSQRRVIEEALDHFKRIPLSGCIVTKVDESVGLGEVLSVSMQHELPITYITTGQRVPEDIEVAKKVFLIKDTVSILNRLLSDERHKWSSQVG